MSKLTELTERLWTEYFNGDEERVFRLLTMLREDISIIGTGKHEFYENLHDFKNAVLEEIKERKNIAFQFCDLKCKEEKLSDEVSLVYGSVTIKWKNESGSVRIDMDSRFSILYKKYNGEWKIVHIHQSTPDKEQLSGEYYPKTLTHQMETANQKIESLTRLATIDGLTELINLRAFKEKYDEYKKKDAWLFVIDIDEFKGINDQYGHLKGNQVLVELAKILTSVIREDDLVCRMGGDEFILFCTEIKEEKHVRSLAERLLDNVCRRSDGEIPMFGISIGITRIEPGEPLEGAFKRADHALYNSKKSGKGRYSICYQTI